ncbi:MAG: HlyD family efflux transporter periplasmic adaptor subunit [Oscillospiraceae bacterium]
MNTIVTKTIAVIVSLFLLAYVGYQTYLAMYDPYETEVVSVGKYNIEAVLDGFFVRNETVITGEVEKTIGYNCKNGQKVAADAVIANVYEKDTDLINVNAIEELQKLRDTLSSSQGEGVIKGAKLDTLSLSVDRLELELIKCVNSKQFALLDGIYLDLLADMNKYKVCVNNQINYDQTIALIDTQIEELKKSTNMKTTPIKSDSSGYFSNAVDSYEGVFNSDYIKNISVDGVKKSLEEKQTPPKKSVGKVISSAQWQFVSLIDVGDAQKFSEGQEIVLDFDAKTSKSVPATVQSIKLEQGSDKAVVVVSSDYMDENFSTIRFEKPTARTKTYEGIIIPKEAIRFSKEGKPGAYTLLGKSVRFRLADPIYEDQYIFISRSNDNSNYITNYDEVIIKGKDLDAKSGGS